MLHNIEHNEYIDYPYEYSTNPSKNKDALHLLHRNNEYILWYTTECYRLLHPFLSPQQMNELFQPLHHYSLEDSPQVKTFHLNLSSLGLSSVQVKISQR